MAEGEESALEMNEILWLSLPVRKGEATPDQWLAMDQVPTWNINVSVWGGLSAFWQERGLVSVPLTLWLAPICLKF